MKNAVLFSIKGSEEKPAAGNDKIKALARSIAAGANATPFPIGKHTFVSEKDILFIGSEVSGGGKLNRTARRVLKELTNKEVKLVVLFTVAKSEAISALPNVKQILSSSNVPVHEEEFVCVRTSGGKKIGPPSDEDLQRAKQFATDVVKQSGI